MVVVIVAILAVAAVAGAFATGVFSHLSGPGARSTPGGTPSPKDYNLTFLESGLPSGSTWWVVLAGSNASSSSGSVSFSEPNGTYSYVIAGPSDYVTSAPRGNVTVAGSGTSVSVPFVLKPAGGSHNVSLGGATAAYPENELAASWFDQNNSDVTISVDQGGSAAGLEAVCSGELDIGVSSLALPGDSLEVDYDCPTTAFATAIAYDGVDIVVNHTNPHGLLSLGYDTLTLIYDRASATTPTLVATSEDGVALPTGFPTGALAWDNLPAAVAGASVGGMTEQVAAGYAGFGGTGQAAGSGALAGDIVTPSTDPSPCGWTICAGPFTSTEGASATSTVVPEDLNAADGSTQVLESRLFGAVSSTGFAGSYGALGFQGCGSANLLSDCGISLTTAGAGTPAQLAAEVASNVNALGYLPDPVARGSPGIGPSGIVPFLALGESLTVESGPSAADGGVVPTLGGTGTYEAAVAGTSSANQYAGWLPFLYITTSAPSGETAEFIDFVMEPACNENLASESGTLSVYSL